MDQKYHTFSRRDFLKQLSGGIALAGSALTFPQVFASIEQPLSAFEFRKAAPLLSLHFNENSLGMSPKALLAAQQAIKDFGNRYPDSHLDILKTKLAEYNDVSEAQIVMGNGSTDVLAAVVDYAASLQATIIEPTPTFGEVSRRAKARGLQVLQIDTDEDFVTDIKKLQQKAATIKGAVLFNICNPNNPTGTIVNKQVLQEWIEAAPDSHVFLIDEAYLEYAQDNPDYSSALPIIKQGRENVIVARTFSKIYGMAGMRIGYGIALPDTMKKVAAFGSSFNISIGGVVAAIESLADEAFFTRSLISNNTAKQILINALTDLELRYIPSDTNFILHRINSDLASYSQRMLTNNIKVGRRMTSDDGWNRISLGQPDEMKAFVKTLYAFRQQGWV